MDYEMLWSKLSDLIGLIDEIPEGWEQRDHQERHIAFRYYPDSNRITVAFVTASRSDYSHCNPIAIPEEEERDRKGFVYVLRVDNGLCKIGETKYLDDRIYRLEIILPYDPELVCAIKVDDRLATEDELHELFTDAGKHVKGEWFELTEADVEYIKGLGAQDG